ncbi:hypothetical protein SprV_0200758300 [Sparganum proliferum]
MEFPEPPSDTVQEKKRPSESADQLRRALSHDPVFGHLGVSSTSGSALCLSPSSLPSAPACSDENNAATRTACSVQLFPGHCQGSARDSAVAGTGRCTFTSGRTKLATRRNSRCKSAPPSNKLKITTAQQETANEASSSISEKKKKEGEEGKVLSSVVEPQIYKPIQTCGGSGITTTPSVEKTDIGYLFVCKEDKLVRIPIKLDVDRKEERHMQNISADCDAMKYLKSSKDRRFVSMRKKAMEEIDMDLKKLFENCDWVQVADSSLFKPRKEAAFKDDVRTQEPAENRCILKAPTPDAGKQTSMSSTHPQREEVLDYSAGSLTCPEAQTHTSITCSNQSSLKRSFVRLDSTKDPRGIWIDQFKPGKCNLQINPFQTVKRYKSCVLPKSKSPSPTHQSGTAAMPGGIAFRPAILTVPGLTPARLSGWRTSPANSIFQPERPLECCQESKVLLSGCPQGVSVAGGPEAATVAAVKSAQDFVCQPNLASQGKSSWNGTLPRLCFSNASSTLTSYCNQTLRLLPTDTTADAKFPTDKRPEAPAGYTGQSFSSLARLVWSEDSERRHAAALVANKNSTVVPTTTGFKCKAAKPDVEKCIVLPEHHYCPSAWPRAGNVPSGTSHPLSAETVSPTNRVLESLGDSQRQAVVTHSSDMSQRLTDVTATPSNTLKIANTQTTVTCRAANSFRRVSSNWVTADLPPGVFAHHNSIRPDTCVRIKLDEPGLSCFLAQPAIMPVKSYTQCCFPAPNVNVLDLRQEVPMDLSQRSTSVRPTFLPDSRRNGSLVEPSTGGNSIASSPRETAVSTLQHEATVTAIRSTQSQTVGTDLPRVLAHACMRCHREPKNCICPRPFAILPSSGVPPCVSLNPAHCYVHSCSVASTTPELTTSPSNFGTKAPHRPQDIRPFECNQCSINYSSRGHLLKHYHSRQHLTRLCGSLQHAETTSCNKPLPPEFLRSLKVDEDTGELSGSEVDKIAKFMREQTTSE